MTRILDYLVRRSPDRPKTELDYALTAERGRWIRRRLLIYASISLAMTCGGLLISAIFASQRGPVLGTIDSLITVVLLVAALVLAYRTAPSYHRILRIAVMLYLVINVMNLVTTRLAMMSMGAQFEQAYERGVDRGVDYAAEGDNALPQPHVSISVEPPADAGPASQPGSMPATRATARATARVYLKPVAFGATWLTLASILFFNHALASFFIPWTWRDTLRPALILTALYAAGVIVDAQWQQIPPLVWVPTLALAPLAFGPGLLVCWWRYSRFNKSFRLQFESRGYRALQGELDGARRIHDACLSPPLHDGSVRVNYAYQPMRHIGGDLIFIHPRPDQQAETRTIAVIDVMGHGIAAALTVNRIVGELERVVSEQPEIGPAELLTALNHYANLTLSRHSVFMTALAVRIEPETRSLRYANAGHPLPVICRTDGTHESPDSTAMLLGAVGPANFTCEEMAFSFNPGDRFFAYTDGATDARNTAGQILGTAGVVKTIRDVYAARAPQHHAAQMILDAVRAHRGGVPEDDVLVVDIALG